MENLVHDILENILFRLPSGAASSQAKCVCKSWKKILSNRRHNEVGCLFACHDYKDEKIQLFFGEEYEHIGNGNKMMNYRYSHDETLTAHGRFAYKSYGGDFLVGSCNGLVCFEKEDPGMHTPGRDWVSEPFTICNPLTRELIFLKTNVSGLWDEPSKVSTGFGYCQSTNEYKVVRLYSSRPSHVQVYTVGSNKWRYIETIINNHTFYAPGIFANGVLHWLDDDGIYIATFHLEDEKFRELPMPPSEAYERRNIHPWNELKLLGGNLCCVKRNKFTSIDIWAYKKNNLNNTNTTNRYVIEEYDQKRDYYSKNSWNWVKDFSIECGDSYYKPYAITKSNEVLMLGIREFYCYDPKTRTIRKLGDDDNVMDYSRIQVIPHANTYVSLKDSGETWYGPGSSDKQLCLVDRSFLDFRRCRGR